MMEEMKFDSFNDAMLHLANVTGRKVFVAAKKEVDMKSRVATTDAKEVKDDLYQLAKKSNSRKMNMPAKSVLGTSNLGNMTVKELVDKLRDTIGKADEE